jgi:hypothetical protein
MKKSKKNQQAFFHRWLKSEFSTAFNAKAKLTTSNLIKISSKGKHCMHAIIFVFNPK